MSRYSLLPMTLLERLRYETQPHHSDLEACLGLPRSKAHYCVQIQRFHGFLVSWETTIEKSEHASLLQGRAKRHLTRADLEFAGLTRAEIENLPRCYDLPQLETQSQILGSIYVLEGSTLGGQMISRHLEKNLGFGGGEGYRYHQSYGAEVPAKWREFKDTLVKQSGADTDNEIVASAACTFASLHAWFAGTPSLAQV